MTTPIDSNSLRAYLRDVLRADMARLPDDDAPLISSGVIDSFALVDLVAFLERSGGFRIRPGEVRLDNLDSVARILAFCRSKGPQA
ncbi:MAG: hypothetical protein BIFFINMI_03503 [Phycisphaerae bacterium]|nr:hypothetical protein [Phycisphaerae bacterium]